MADALHRISYDASIDDAVEASWRLANRTQAFQRQLRQHIIIASVAAGLLFLVVWIYIGGGRTPSQLAITIVLSVGCGLIFPRMFRGELVKQIRKQQRKVVAEHFGGKMVIQSELELRPENVWVRQGSMEMTFPWNICTGVRDNPDDIEINFSPGICVVRNRYFASPADRQNFLDTAKRLAGQ
jgi:hypothetical protein